MPTYADEVAYLSGLNADGTLAQVAYNNWNGNNPATYSGANTVKWQADASASTAGTPSGTIKYWFDSGWTTDHKQTFTAALTLWSAVANITFEQTSDMGSAQLKVVSQSGPPQTSLTYALTTGVTVGGAKTRQITGATLNMIPTGLNITQDFFFFGLPSDNFTALLHEIGHALGLGNGGPYPLGNQPWPDTLQYSPYDTKAYTVMSSIHPEYPGPVHYNEYPVKADWVSGSPQTPMMADIDAIQRLYGARTAANPSILTGDTWFGFNTNITGPLAAVFDFARNIQPILTLWSAGANNTLDVSGFFDDAVVNLNSGGFSSVGGQTNNIAIARYTSINRFVGGGGHDRITGNNNGNEIQADGGDDTIIGGTGDDTIIGGRGNNVIDGGGGTDTAALGAALSDYSLVRDSDGSVTAIGRTSATGFSVDRMTNVEVLAFADQTIWASDGINNNGNDAYLAVAGNDTLNGGDGIDAISYANASSGVRIDLARTDLQQTNGSGFDTLSNFEILIGSSRDDFLSGNATTLSITSGSGNDSVTDLGSITTVDGGPGYDFLALKRGNISSDVTWEFLTGAGEQTYIDGTVIRNFETLDLVTGSGNDALSFDRLQNSTAGLNAWNAGGGNDTIDLDFSHQTSTASRAITMGFTAGVNGQVFRIGGDADIHLTNVENMRVIGGSGDDSLTGLDGNDVFQGRDGSDTLKGGLGTNQLDGGKGRDVAVYTLNRSAYTITLEANGIRVTGSGVTDMLSGIESMVFADQTVSASTIDPRLARVSDFNLDGRSDVLLQNDNGQAGLWLAGSDSIIAIGSNPGPAWHARGSGDFDGNGKADIVWQDDSGQVMIWQMDGAAVAGSVQVAGPASQTWLVKDTGDFDGDGRDDILLQSRGGQARAWLMNGTTFQSALDLGANPGPNWKIKAAGDFNGDGKSDVVWQRDDGEAAVSLTGVGGLASIGKNFDAGWEIKGTGDFNADGKSEILWSNPNGGYAIWYQYAEGGWTYDNPYNQTDPTWQIKGAIDFEDDDKADILWQNSDGRVRVTAMAGFYHVKSTYALATNPGTDWHVVTESPLPPRPPANDLDGDGKSDLVLQHESGLTEIWLLNGSSVKSSYRVHPGSSAWKIADTADFDADGKGDMALQHDSGLIEVWLLNGDRVKSSYNLNPGSSSWKIAGTGVFDADADGDLVMQHDSGLTQMWLMNGSSVQSTQSLNPGAGWKVMATGDFNGDGKSDVAMQSISGQAAIWLAGATSLANAGPVLTGGWNVRSSGDFNGDGKSDLVLQHGNGLTEIWLMDGATRSSSVRLNPGSSNWKVINTGDFDGDRQIDLVLQHDSGVAQVWLMDGTGVRSTYNVDPGSSSWRIAGNVVLQSPYQTQSDFNGDFKSDLLLANGGGQVQVWVLDGATRQSSYGMDMGSGRWQVAASSDFDRDGRSDVALRHDTGLTEIWLLNGSSVKSSYRVDPGSSSWRIVGADDFNGDGKGDLVLQHDNGLTQIWLMNGSSVSSFYNVNPGSNSWKMVGTGDVDADGRSDLVLQNDSGSAQVWMMNGSGVRDIASIGAGSDTRIRGAGDFNGDGKTDILMQYSHGQAAIWFVESGNLTNAGPIVEAGWRIGGTGDFDGDGRSDIILQDNSGQTQVWIMNGATRQSVYDLASNPGSGWLVTSA